MERYNDGWVAAAIFAMLFGGYAGINPEVVEEFQTTGIVHILSVSGTHMSLLAAATVYVSMAIGISRRIMLIIGVVVIGTYALMSGMLPQVIRSGIMGILVLVAMAARVESMGARILTLTGLLMIMVKPLLIYDISFQLSFGSTAGLMYLTRRMRLKGLPSWISYPAAMTISAQLASLPIVIWYFNEVSLSSVMANVLVMPILDIVIVWGLLGGIISLVIPFIGKIVFIVESIMFGMGAEINRLIVQIPFSQIQVPTIGLMGGLLYYLWLIYRRIEIWLMLMVIIIFSIRGSGELEVSFVDVGQGDCAVVKTPNNKCLIFDTGGVRDKAYDVGGRVLIPYLRHENIREVDTIFLTHVHEDHSGGAGSVIKEMRVGEIITAGESKSEYAAVFGISDDRLDNLRQGKVGEKFNIDGVEVQIIYAPEVGTGNEISNVYRIRYGDISFLITGDLVKEVEEQMLREKVGVESTVLKVGHHGSATSTSEEFLRAVKAKCAVISVGYGNNFGHPKSEVLERLNSLKMKVYRTDRDGLIKFKSNGKRLTVKKYRKRKKIS